MVEDFQGGERPPIGIGGGGKWRSSPLINHEEVQKDLDLPERVQIRSLDIRESAYQPGFVLDLEDKLKITEVIAGLGVPEIECGWQAENKRDYDIVKMIDKAGIDIVKSGMVRILIDDVEEQMDISADAGCDNIKISMVPETREVGERFKVAEKTIRMIEHGKKLGLPIVFCFVHTMMGDLPWMMEILKSIPPKDLAAMDKFQIFEDEVGSPPVTRWITRQFKEALPGVPLLIHCHDSLGLGTANTLAGIEAGCTWTDVCINGYGGNAPLEEVVPALEVLYGVDTGIDMTRLYDASKTLDRITGTPREFNRPVVGEARYARIWPEVVADVLSGEESIGKWGFGNFEPEVVGQRYSIFWENSERTKTLTTDLLKTKLALLGLEYTDTSLKELQRQLDEIIGQRVWITDEEFDGLCRKLL